MAATLFSVPPQNLATVRELSHAAAQWASRAARANLPAAADDSHSNLGWNDSHFALLSHPLDAEQRLQLGFGFRDCALLWLENGELIDSLSLQGADEAAAKRWCDEQLAAAGLQGTDQAEMPYELPPVDYSGFDGAAAELEVLGAWFGAAQSAIEDLVSHFGGKAVAPALVRCWPHHFDLATLFMLEEGDPETARSVGVGLSPGDGSYAEPYFYCTPWPTPAELPDAPAPMHWHTEGFTSMVCEATRLDESVDLKGMLTSAVEVAHRSLYS
ncbi:MAG: hypothetical protein QNI86_13655 [Halieaceae bacterium]|nr:hypothetical protein [Halieaceae bacterium]